MKEETRKVVVLDWEDKIKLQSIIKDLEKLASSYSSVCKDATIINNTLYYLKIIDEKISQCIKVENIKFKANIQCMQNREIHIALHNSGYRYLNKTNDVYTYGKPIGYGILRADFHPSDMEIEILLIVKGNIKDGKRPNLLWTLCRQEISSEYNDQYLNCVQTIRDCEAEIFDNSPVAILENRSVRYDFKENSTLDIE